MEAVMSSQSLSYSYKCLFKWPLTKPLIVVNRKSLESLNLPFCNLPEYNPETAYFMHNLFTRVVTVHLTMLNTFEVN